MKEPVLLLQHKECDVLTLREIVAHVEVNSQAEKLASEISREFLKNFQIVNEMTFLSFSFKSTLTLFLPYYVRSILTVDKRPNRVVHVQIVWNRIVLNR